MKRVIQKYVQDRHPELILQGKIHEVETVKVTADKRRHQRPGGEAGG